MKVWELLDSGPTLDGGQLTLHQRGASDYLIRIDGQELMSSRTHGSETELGRLGCQKVRGQTALVLIGGLGMGFTVRGALDQLGPKAKIVVAEMSPQVEAWNRGILAPLTNDALSDPRVSVEIGNVYDIICTRGSAPGPTNRNEAPLPSNSSSASETSSKQEKRIWDVILLDVDNGPSALCTPGNRNLYDRSALWRMRNTMSAKGVLIVWSSGPDAEFVKLMNQCGFKAEAVRVSSMNHKGPKHTLFVGFAR
jgi:spermidine synthase